jgi:hypothetical protein
MTQPLPNPSTKTAPAASSRLDIGNFFQPSAQLGAAPDFESLFAGQNPNGQRDASSETEPTSKKKKSPIEETPLSAQPVADLDRAALDSTPSLESQHPNNSEYGSNQLSGTQNPASQLRSDTAEHASEAEKNAFDPSADSTQAENANQESKEESVESKSLKDVVSEEIDAENSKESSEVDSVVDGMETASTDAEMISLATMDEVESGSPVAAREPLVTSSHRFSVAAAIGERAGLAAISASGSSPESQLGQAGTGSPQGQVNITQPTSNQSSQAAQSVLKNLGAELEKFRQSGESQVQLEIPVSDSESVKVRLNLRAGELRSTFITDSAELREALQKAWPEFSQTSRERGFRFGDPSFQNAFSQNDSPSQGRQRQSDRENSLDLQPITKTPIRRSAVSTAASGRTALWA